MRRASRACVLPTACIRVYIYTSRLSLLSSLDTLHNLPYTSSARAWERNVNQPQQTKTCVVHINHLYKHSLVVLLAIVSAKEWSCSTLKLSIITNIFHKILIHTYVFRNFGNTFYILFADCSIIERLTPFYTTLVHHVAKKLINLLHFTIQTTFYHGWGQKFERITITTT